MTIENIHQRARGLQAKTRRQLLGHAAVLAVVAGFYIFAMKKYPPLQPLFALALLWSVAGAYFLNRGMWPAAMPGDAAMSTGLAFYRGEIERRRRYFQRAVLWSFAPVVLAIGGFILALANLGGSGRAVIPNGLPFMVLVAVWVLAYFVIRVKEQRELRREIEDLAALENAGREPGLP